MALKFGVNRCLKEVVMLELGVGADLLRGMEEILMKKTSMQM